METLLQLSCKSLIKNFLIERHLAELIEGLVALENINKPKTLCFKFSADDSLVTTIDDLQNDLIPSNATNYNFMMERLEGAIENDSLRVFLS